MEVYDVKISGASLPQLTEIFAEEVRTTHRGPDRFPLEQESPKRRAARGVNIEKTGPRPPNLKEGSKK